MPTRANAPTAAPRSTRSRRFASIERGLSAAMLAALALVAAPARADPGDPDVQPQQPTPDTLPTERQPGQGLSASLGGAAWSGHYGFARLTTISSALLDVRYQQGPFRVSAAVPYFSIDSDARIYAGIDGTPIVLSPTRGALPFHRDGVGDLTLGAAWTVLDEARAGVDLELSTRVKVATGAGRLSTGKADAAFEIEASKTLGRVVPVASIAYRTFGDPAGVRLYDGFAGSAGASLLVGHRAVILATYDYAERTSAFLRSARAATLGASAPLGRRLRLTGYTSLGLSSGAAAVSGGLSLGVRFR